MYIMGSGSVDIQVAGSDLIPWSVKALHMPAIVLPEQYGSKIVLASMASDEMELKHNAERSRTTILVESLSVSHENKVQFWDYLLCLSHYDHQMATGTREFNSNRSKQLKKIVLSNYCAEFIQNSVSQAFATFKVSVPFQTWLRDSVTLHAIFSLVNQCTL